MASSCETVSVTGSEKSDHDEDEEEDSPDTGNSSEEEEGSVDAQPHQDDEYPNIVWTGAGKKTPILIFKPEAIEKKEPAFKVIGEKYHLAFKIIKTECKLLRNILSAHGFHEAHPNSNDFNLMWTGSHLKPYTLRTLTEFQKVNHFPRSYEITRKDRLFKNVQRMQHTKGVKHFDFVPMSFIMPGEFQDFCTAFLKDKGPWIVKPIASSRGRGIFLVNHPEQVPLDETVIVCRYIPNPLLIDEVPLDEKLIVSKYVRNPLLIQGFKFDVRLYVAVTSYDPLSIYLYEEGLTRFATVRYDKNAKNIRNQMMHLTNYSVNKKSKDYVPNDDPDVEDYGNKWSLGAMLRYLRAEGYDTTALMMRMEDVIIKTIISAELPIATACKMFIPYRGNCFELYGFDVLIDTNLRPWILEVNLSPSLACDAPLDLKIKGNMLSDLFSLTGFICHDPMMRKVHQSARNQEFNSRNAARAQSAHHHKRSSVNERAGNYYLQRSRPQSAGSVSSKELGDKNKGLGGVTTEEMKMIRRAREEYNRRGGWVRIFPTADSWDLYGQFLQFTTTNNLTLHQKLYPHRHNKQNQKSNLGYSASSSKLKSLHIHSAPHTSLGSEFEELVTSGLRRSVQYERKLTYGKKRKSKAKKKVNKNAGPQPKGSYRGTLVQGVMGEEEDTPTLKSEPSSRAPTATESKTSHSRAASEPNQSVTSLSNTQSKTDSNKFAGSNQVLKSASNNMTNKNITQNRPSSAKRATSSAGQNQPSMQSGKHADSKENLPMTTPLPSQYKPPPAQPPPPAHPPASYSSSGRPKTVDVSVKTRAVITQDFEKPPPKPPSPPKFNVVHALEKGAVLSKVQARSAFATYLSRVQERLMSETSNTDKDDIDAANEQMDLVLRFLKRAAVNLQQGFKVVVPSRKLPINDRRRILAKQLADFVHIYNKETDQLSQRTKLEKQHLKKSGDEDAKQIEEDKFHYFVTIATESELEEVLTTYTKLNKSASIFLGSNSKSSSEGAPPAGQTQSDTTLAKRKEMGSQENVIRIPDSRPQSASRQSYKSSYANAVTIYSTKQTPPPRQRPASASTQKTGSSVRSRPMSASSMRSMNSNRPMSATSSRGSRPSSAYKTANGYVDSYNEEAIQEALQRIATRQQARNYAAPSMGMSSGPAMTQSKGAPQGHSAPQGHRNTHTEQGYHQRSQSLDRHIADRSDSNASLQTVSSSSSIQSSQSNTNSRKVTSRKDPQKPLIFPNSMLNGDIQQTISSVSVNIPNGDLPPRSKTSIDGPMKSKSATAVSRTDPRSSYNEFASMNHAEKSKSAHTRSYSHTDNYRTSNLRSANDTFNSFINDGVGDSDDDTWQNAYSQVTGVTPQQSYTPSRGSTQFQIAQQQQLMKQQKMIEQSKFLLEQSKAKHQAMIAQAHAAQKGKASKGEIESAMTRYAPKPPSSPSTAKKPLSSHRLARTALSEDHATYGNQFYTSLKYDTATGISKPSYQTNANLGW